MRNFTRILACIWIGLLGAAGLYSVITSQIAVFPIVVTLILISPWYALLKGNHTAWWLLRAGCGAILLLSLVPILFTPVSLGDDQRMAVLILFIALAAIFGIPFYILGKDNPRTWTHGSQSIQTSNDEEGGT